MHPILFVMVAVMRIEIVMLLQDDYFLLVASYYLA